MDSSGVVNTVKVIQMALKVVALLQLTAYMWPRHTNVQDGAVYDFIVVGAGTAGNVVVNRLTEDPNTNVLVIEAGGDPPMESDLPGTLGFMKNSRCDWNFSSEYDPVMEKCHQKPFFEMTIGKVLGGTSSLNYMTYVRGHPRDYMSWANISKDRTWEWDNILPYLKKAEKVKDPEILNSQLDRSIYGTTGNIGITTSGSDSVVDKYFEAYKELGHDIYPDVNAWHPLGFTRMKLTIADGSRQSTAYAYLRPVKDRTNLHVMKDTMVIKILFDENKNTIGVEALTSEGKTITIKATKEVIVSAGSFNSPKLLMLSGIGPKEQLLTKNINVLSDLPVGENLRDHPIVPTVHAMEKVEEPLDPPNLHEFPESTMIGYVALNKSQGYPDYQVSNYVVSNEAGVVYCSFVYRYKLEICDTIFKSAYGRTVLYSQVIALHPRTKGRVLLRSANPMDPPIIENKYMANEEDLNVIVQYVKNFASIVNTKYFMSVNAKFIDPTDCGNYETGSTEYWKCYASCMVKGMGHIIGTCSMGSVVDSRLRVMGVHRLRVVDASVMPTLPSSGILGPTVMIGEKASDMIKEDNNL